MFQASDQVYSVTFVNPIQGFSTKVQIGSDEYILESAEDQGVTLPSSCNAGKCITCVCRLLEGNVEQDHVFLKPQEIAAGFVLTCKAFPRSHCTLVTHQEDILVNGDF